MKPDEKVIFERVKWFTSIKRYIEAERELHLLLSHEPNNAKALALIGHCKVQRGVPEEGVSDIQQALGLRPDKAHYHYFLAKAYVALKNLDEAHTSIRACLSYEPDDAMYVSYQAYIFLMKNDIRNSLEETGRALALDPNHELGIICRAYCLKLLGQTADAETMLRKALKLSPNNDFYHKLLADVKFSEGNVAAAFDGFMESVRLNPNQEDARADLVKTVKARFFTYRWYLRYIHWRNEVNARSLSSNDTLFFAVTLVLLITSFGSLTTLQAIIVSPLLMVNTAEPIANLALRYTRWRHEMDPKKRWIEWTTISGLLIIILGIVLLFTSPYGPFMMILGVSVISLFGSFYKTMSTGQKRFATIFVTLIMLFGITATYFLFTGPYGFFMMKFFGITTLVYKWGTDGPTAFISY